MNYSYKCIYIFYLIFLILSLVSVRFSDKKRNLILIIQVIMVSLFFGLRNFTVGGDTKTYIDTYLNQETWIDIGMIIINKISYILFKSNWRIYLTIICLLTSINMAFIYKIIFKDLKKYVNVAYWALYCMPYIILMNINIIRQGLALSFLVLGLLLLYLNNKKIGIILIVFACLIHYSMFILMIGFALFLRLKISHLISVLMIIFLFVLSITGISKEIIMLFPDGYIKGRFINFMSLQTNIGLLIKFTFYFTNYIMMIFFSLKLKDRTYNFLSRFMSFLLVGTSFVYMSELTANRFLLSADFLVPIIYIYPMKIFKNQKIYLTLVIFLFIIYFWFSINSSSLIISFNL